MSDEIQTLEPTADVEPAAEPPIPFRLVARNVILRSLRRTSPLQPVLTGDVAIVDGRLIARWWHGQGLAYAELPPDAELTHRTGAGEAVDFNLTAGAVVVDPFGYIAGQAGEPALRRWATLDPETAADKELKTFIARWPSVAAMLGLAHVEAARLFAPGRVRYGGVAGAGSIDWHGYLQRHLTGDWGDHGRHDEAPLTAGQFWSLGLQPAALQNRHAVASGSGWIRSRYALPDDVARQLPASPTRPGHRPAVEVVTAIAGGHAETLMTVAFHPSAELRIRH